MSGLHPTKAMRPPLSLGTEVIAWFTGEIPPTSDRTVIVRVAGIAGALLAFYSPKSRTWFDFSTGGEIDGAIEAWAEQPVGKPVTVRETLTSQVVANLVKTPQGYFSLKFTAGGRALPEGSYALQLASSPTPTIARTS